jgi:hypothetical protein
MKQVYKIATRFSLISHFAICVILVLLFACSGGSDTSSEKGSVKFSLNWEEPGPNSVVPAAQSPSNDVCEDYAIETVSVDIHDASDIVVASDSFACSDHEGSIDDVPAGSGLRLTVLGTTVSGKDEWRGEKLGIVVSAGETTEIGVVDMVYVGDDVEPPTVVSANPARGAADVSIATVVTAAFSEDLSPTSVNASTFKLESATDTVVGTVTYDPSSRIATFTPEIDLAHFTTYTATITTGVEDLAGLSLAAEFSWSFTTVRGPLSWDSGNWDEANWN